MTICNMTIEGGGRAGHDRARRHDVRVDRGPPRRARGLRGRGRALARAAHRRRRDVRPRDHRRRRARSRPLVTWGTTPGAWSSPVTDAGARSRASDGRRARARATWASRPARRCRRSALDRVFIGSCTNSPHRRPARRRRAWSRAARSPATSTRWSCPAPSRCARRPRPRGSTRSSAPPASTGARAGCSMCLGMNPDILAARRALRLDLEPQLRGPPGPRRAHPPRLARRWPPRPRSRATSSTSGSWETDGARQASSPAPCHVLDRADVDTDQIIPKQFLKRVERTGFGEFLFYDWAQEAGWDLPPNPILATGPNFGCGSSREHAPWALAGLRLQGGRRRLASPTSSSPTARRSACCRSCCPRTRSSALMAAGEAEVDLEALEVRFDGRAVPFELDAETPPAPARGPRRHRAHAPAGRRDRGIRARARAFRS